MITWAHSRLWMSERYNFWDNFQIADILLPSAWLRWRQAMAIHHQSSYPTGFVLFFPPVEQSHTNLVPQTKAPFMSSIYICVVLSGILFHHEDFRSSIGSQIAPCCENLDGVPLLYHLPFQKTVVQTLPFLRCLNPDSLSHRAVNFTMALSKFPGI